MGHFSELLANEEAWCEVLEKVAETIRAHMMWKTSEAMWKPSESLTGGVLVALMPEQIARAFAHHCERHEETMHSMDVDELLEMRPEQLAQALLVRRQVLKQELPGVIRNLEAEEESLEPRVKRAVESHRKSNEKVALLKNERNQSQEAATKILVDVKDSREKLIDSGGMVNLDPNWKKEKLLEQLEEIEDSIQTSALDHRSERKLLDRRKKILGENEKWLKSRK